MILKKIIIKDQKELYRHKNYLLGLDLEFNSTKKEYSNSSEINFDNLFELTQFLKNHNFSYSIVEEKITDFKKQILAIFGQNTRHKKPMHQHKRRAQRAKKPQHADI